MKLFFRTISAIFSPLIVPAYGIALALFVTPLSIVPLISRLIVIAVIILMLCVIPAAAVFALYKAGRITDPGLNNRTDRTIPYGITIFCYAMATIYLYSIGSPNWLLGVTIGGIFTILINLIVNLRWKISGHMAAMGGLIAIALFISAHNLALISMRWIVITIILLAGLVGTSRLALNRHTPLQLLAGTANGLLTVYLSALFL